MVAASLTGFLIPIELERAEEEKEDFMFRKLARPLKLAFTLRTFTEISPEAVIWTFCEPNQCSSSPDCFLSVFVYCLKSRTLLIGPGWLTFFCCQWCFSRIKMCIAPGWLSLLRAVSSNPRENLWPRGTRQFQGWMLTTEQRYFIPKQHSAPRLLRRFNLTQLRPPSCGTCFPASHNHLLSSDWS